MNGKIQHRLSFSTVFYFALLILCTVSHLLKTTMKREEVKATGMAAVSVECEQTNSENERQ